MRIIVNWQKVTIFHECEPEFLHDLVLKMRAYIFTPGDLICRKGEVAREMFIIADGLLEVIRFVSSCRLYTMSPERVHIPTELAFVVYCSQKFYLSKMYKIRINRALFVI